MSKLNRIALVLVVALAGSAFNVPLPSARAADSEYENADLTRGGLLYDNWLKLKGAKMEVDHPLYPAEGKKKGATTWRCKECHGWDYRGREGRYSSGSHYTGIAGVWEAREQNPGQLFAALTSASGHDFSPQLDQADLWALVKFLREGLVDTTLAIAGDGSPSGNAAAGKPLYEAKCGRCHGADGGQLDFDGKTPGSQGVGWITRKNPQETLHKVRWGHPGSDMPSAVTDGRLSTAATVDLLAYGATLP